LWRIRKFNCFNRTKKNVLELKQTNITLREIDVTDFRFLFNLLKQRDVRANISHKKMPTYNDHVKFVKSKPYTKWYIIQKSKIKVGSIYLSKNDEIGIFINEKFHGEGFATDALKLLINKNPRSRYLANVNPKNLRSAKFFKKNNFKLIQHTYELEKI
jgi:RimJ/RimL family protein N-acetyltransferase